MARIAGIDLPSNKKSKIGLTYIFGIGVTTAQYILDKAGVDGEKRIKDLTEQEVKQIRTIITNEITVEGALRNKVKQDIKRLMEINCYRGVRHKRHLPVRGQRTKTNAKTRRRV
ncbi:MAG: 30S ribosomal protein S13 [Candidatus Marinimicrobia bacterium]|nr:30S ribosomal protein S13 [Candidatus Neomarinimicrobiota bacterium]